MVCQEQIAWFVKNVHFRSILCQPEFLINLIIVIKIYYVGRAMRKCVFGHMPTAKVQISLRIRAVWSELSLSANRIIGHYRMYPWRENVRMRLCACVGWIWICSFWTCSKLPFMHGVTDRCYWWLSFEWWFSLIYDEFSFFECFHLVCPTNIHPSRHMTLIQCRLNVDATSWRCIDVEPTLYKHHVPAGIYRLAWSFFSCSS